MSLRFPYLINLLQLQLQKKLNNVYAVRMSALFLVQREVISRTV